MVNNDNKNKPILGRGEVYVQPHTSKGSFSRDDFRPSFEDACVKLRTT